jgi:hypothetical protein
MKQVNPEVLTIELVNTLRISLFLFIQEKYYYM